MLMGNLGAGISKLLVENFSQDQLQTIALVNKPYSLAESLCYETLSYPPECIIDGKYNVEAIVELCSSHCIDAIIPLTDHETVLMSEWQRELPFLFCSQHDVSLACHDKWQFQRLLDKVGADAPDTWLPSQCPALDVPYLVKPRTGGLSRGIVWGSPELSQFNDDHIVQRCLEGTEVTVAVYKALDGKCWGPFVGERHLFSGMTCYFKPITPNIGINQFITQFAQMEGWRGPCNIQGMIQEERFIPFEVNLRFSGSSSLRDLLGFKDVVWAVEEWLGLSPNVHWVVKDQYAIRYFADHLISQ